MTTEPQSPDDYQDTVQLEPQLAAQQLEELAARSPDAAKLAQRMARAAGPQSLQTMAQASYILCALCSMIHNPERYFQTLERLTAGEPILPHPTDSSAHRA